MAATAVSASGARQTSGKAVVEEAPQSLRAPHPEGE